MREIEFRMFKFRAWSGREKKYIHPNNICINLLVDNRVFTRKRKYNSDVFEPAQHIILQQFTGLKDKNGVEIYEGDICLTNNIHGYDGEEIGYVEVKYDNEECRYVISNNNFEIGFEDIYPSDIEVVGNIYENPELLEQNNEND